MAEGSSLYTCDLCPKAVFHSKAALAAHADEKHAGFVPDRAELISMAELIRPRHQELATLHTEKWSAVGGRIFQVASGRDAGPARLKQACDARAQLELVARRWRSTAEVYVFGSSVAMGLWDGLSDIDCTVIDVEAFDANEWPPNEKAAVRSLATLFRNIGFSFQNLEPIEHARVPIIKHNATVPAVRVLGKDYERLLSRSIRCLFDQPQAAQTQRVAFEDAVAASVGTAPETVWWDPGYRTCGMTLRDNTTAVATLLHIATSAPGVSAAPLHNEFRPDVFHVDFDLSFRTFGIRNSHLLHAFLCAHPCGRPGALVLKDWSKISGVNNSINGFLTSYAVNIMWIYFLVRKGHVPYVAPQSIPQSLAKSGQSKDPQYLPLIPQHIVSDAAARDALHAQMGRLLYEFFAFYCFEFDWDSHVVSLNREHVTTKAELGWTDGDEVRLAKRNTRYLMCIEDPYEENLNLGRHLGEVRARKVKAELLRGLVTMVRDDVSAMGAIFGDARTASKAAGEPSVLHVSRLLAAAVTGAATYTSDEFRATLERVAPDSLAHVLEHWSWDETVRRLGYKQVSGHVFPVKPVSTRKPFSPETIPAAPPAPKPMSEVAARLVDEFLTERAKADAVPVPEWVTWHPPTVPLPPPPGGRIIKTSFTVGASASTALRRWSPAQLLRCIV
jgi:hypothetical protein